MAFGIHLSYLVFIYFSIPFKFVEALNEVNVGTDCLDLLHRGFNSTGVYDIDPDGKGAFQVLCDQETNGGGWIVFQKRFNGTVDFERNWVEYREGFGNFFTEFWLGNEKLHRLTSSMNHQLLVEVEAFSGEKAHASYETFTVDSESDKYRLFVDGYFGTTGGTDSLGPRHSNKMFTTSDSDNDRKDTENCAVLWQGGWWFDDCLFAFLNGPYNPTERNWGILWEKWKSEQLKQAAMKTRANRERPVDYYLSFPGSYPQDFSSVSIVLEFKELTVSWWIRGPPTQNWSAVFSIAHSQEDRKVAFLYQEDRQCKVITEGDEREFTTSHAFVDSKWHLVVFVWEVTTGQFRLHVDDKVEYNGQTFQISSTFSGGHLILGQSQNSYGSILEGRAMRADIMHFNMWERMFTEAEALELYLDCNVRLGNLVQWPEINIAFRGNVTRTPFVRCLPKANYDWPLASVNNAKRLEDQITSKTSIINVADNYRHTYLGVLTRTGNVGVYLASYPGECLGYLNNCSNGLSVSFWMNYNALFVSYILGLRNEYYDVLRMWVGLPMTQTARWEPCYRAIHDGFGAQTFHENCPNHAVTVTLVKVGKYVFGGFADQRWGGTGGNSQYLWSGRAFLFSLVNPAGLQPVKLDIKPDKFDKALLQDPQAGPVFGENDVFIGNNADQSAVSFSDLGHAYELPSVSYQAGTISARRFLAGSYKFIPDDIEVFFYNINAKKLSSSTFTANNTYENLTYAPFRARPSSPNPWCANANSGGQYLQIDLMTQQSVGKIELVKHKSDTKYVKKYQVMYKVHGGGNWKKYNNSEVLDGQNPALVSLPSARYIRLYPKSWQEDICMRVRLYKEQGGNYTDLGVDDPSAIPDDSFRARSWLCCSTPHLGKFESMEKCHAAWCGQGPSTWLQINFQSKQMLVKMATRGPQQGNPVASFYIEYSHDGATWLNYTEGGVRRIFYGNWDTTWVYYHFLPHLETQFLRIIPQNCGSICCLNVDLWIPKDVIGYIIASFNESTFGEGFAVYHKYVAATGNSSYHLRFATTQKIWSMELHRTPAVPFRWVHVTITWSEAWGLNYYEDGRLVQKTMTFEVYENGSNPYDYVVIGKAPKTAIAGLQPSLQLSELIFRYSYLTSEAVKESVNLSDLNSIFWYKQSTLDFDWQQLQTDCTPSNDTGPCHGETAEKFMFIEASLPQQKGDVAWLVTRPTVPTRNCFTFWYHMHGNTTGRLNLYLRTHDREAKVLIWRLAGSRANAWKRGQIPIFQRYSYQILIEGVVGGYLGDIAVSDPVLSVNGSCSYLPEEARPLKNVSECRSTLGMESGAISDGQITASSATSSAHAYRGRLSFQNTDSQSGAWSASVTDENQWLQIDMGGTYYTTVTRVATQGRNGLAEWVTKYKLQYSYNEVDFKYYKEQDRFTDKEFTGNMDSDTIVSHDLTPPIVSRYVRFRILTWSGGIAMRVELYGCQTECQSALGMESGAISDMQIRASSEYSADHAAIQARLNYNVPGKTGSWSALTIDKNPWLQIDLLSRFAKVTRVATQGRRDYDQWVTKYNLKYSVNGLNFLYYRESEKRNDKVFAGNTDRNTIVSHDLKPPITARFFRFLPLHWSAHISMRVELYGCHVIETLSALGMEGGEISDRQISASSEYDTRLDASQSRLNTQPSAGKLGSWAAASNDVHQWLQVDLGVYSIVTRVSTQGRSDYNQWVTKYKLKYGHHPATLYFYKRSYHNDAEEFFGNTNRDTVVSHDLSPPITARYVRFLPLQWSDHISMRVELYGCHETVCDLPCLEGQFCDEVLGQCVCDPTMRGEEWCRTRQRFSPLPIDQLLESAAFYWTMDNYRNIYNVMGSDYGVAPVNATTIKGIRGKAVKVYGGSSAFTLNEGLPPNECLFNTSQCTNGFTLMLWLWYRHKDSRQVFLDSSSGSYTGHKMFQTDSSSPQVAFQIVSSNKNCKVVFPTPKEIWTHYTLSYTSTDDLGNIKVFLNGGEVEDFAFEGCSDGSFGVSDATRMSIGDPQGQLPEAAFDEIIIWYRSLTSADIATAYDYYKGDANLLLLANLHLTGRAWKANLLDHESETYKNWTKAMTNQMQSLYHNKPGYRSVTVYKYWEASGAAGCEFALHFTDRGYSAVEPFINWLSTTPYQINNLEANDIFITAVSLHAQSFIKERSIDLNIMWNGPTELNHGIFQGYELFYQDTTLGNESKVILRTTGDTFYVIQNLVPYTKYLITARSFTLEGDGKMSEPLSIWTAPLAPTQSPTNIAAFKLNSTSLQVTWTKIPADQVGGVIKGYRVVFNEVNNGNSSLQSTVLCGGMNQTVLTNLQIFTNFSIRILGFTWEDKLGPVSDPVYAMTDEDVPTLPPSNVTAQVINSSSIIVRWDPVPVEGRNGIILGYEAWYRKIVVPPVWKRMESCGVYWCEATNLEMDNPYRISVRGFTVKGVGPFASVEAITEKNVPRQPLTNLTAHNTSSTSILVTLYPVPLNESNEPIIAFELILSTADNSSENETITAILGNCENTTKITHHQTNLQEYTAYSISVAGVTKKGFTKSTHKITVFTDEDAPEGSPQNITPAASSATGLTLSWKPLTNDKANGLILGYHILLFDKLRNITKNITVYSLDQANIENLFPYTEYEARIVPFNSKGLGNASDVIVVKTKEAAPSEPPSNVTGVVPSSTSLTLDWKPVDPLHINGVLRAYVITYFVTNSPHVTRQNISIPVTSGRKRRAISDPSSQSYELSGLKKYTTYTIQVMAYTVDYGVPSDEVNLTTAQDVPSRSPTNVTAFNTSSTAINVTWLPVPDDHANGIVLGYLILYREANKPFEQLKNISMCARLLEVEITGLEFFTNYEIRVLAYTIVGEGNISHPVFCMTDEDVPEGAPVNLSTLPANTTAITVKWLPVAEEDRNGYILGYWVSISNITGEFIKNVSVYGSDMLTILGGLDIWTNYSVQVRAFNVKGNGPWSETARGITDEEAPRVAPSNVTAFNTSSTSLRVTWQPISTQGLRGILRAYRVYYIEKETYFIRSLRNVTVDRNTLEVELVDLYKFTNYSVYVVARTNKDGVSSEKVNISTDEDTPGRAPVDVVVGTPHSTSIHVSWNEVPNGYKNGIIRGYKINYTEPQQNAPVVTEDIPPFERSLSITGLKKFTLYNITVLAYTSKGDGVPTSTAIMTDQDVPDVAPLNVRAVSTWTTNTIPLSWTHIPNHLLNGILTGYRIRYEAIEMGEYPYEETPREVILPPGTVSTTLTGLESFTVYLIEITGLTVKGDGPSEVLFAETCRCRERLTTNWMVLDPYVTPSKSTTQRPGGLLPRFVDDMAVTCCQTCKTHGESYVDFEFNGQEERALQHTEEALRLNILHATDLTFPVYGYKLQDNFRHEFGYTGIVESPGIAYVINTNYGNKTPTSLVHAVFACWPLALLGILLAYIFGFMMWALDQAQNTEHFPRSFFSGIWEGFWWAYVSMTTVGYGDRTPLSNVGRIVAIIWTLAGVVIIGILVGFIAVSLTSVSFGVDYKLYGANISAIYGSAEYNLGLRRNAKFDKEKKHRNFEDIYELLSSNQISGVLIDGYVVGSKKHLFEKPFLRIYRIYDYSSVYGVVTAGNSTKLGKCFHDYIQQNTALIFQYVADNVEAIQESPEPLEVERSTGVFDSSNQLFRQNLMILSGALGVGILLGVIWEIIHRVRKRSRIRPQDNTQVYLLSTEIRQMFADFKSQIFKLALELKEKHRLQRQHLLTAKKSCSKYRYEQLKSATRNSAEERCENEHLTSGIVMGPRMFQKVISEQENMREQSPDPRLIENLAPFHVTGGKGESKA